MRKLHIVLLGMFVVGVLLGGIGVGVTLVEYSGFEYGGKVYLGEENLVTKDLDYKFTPSANERIQLNYCYWGDWQKDTLIVQDESIPIGIIRYRVTYNENLANPSLMHWNVEDVEEQEWSVKDAQITISETILDEDVQEMEEYAQSTVSPVILDEEKEQRRKIVVQLESNRFNDEFTLFMENKDRILEELKQKKITSYEIVRITDVEILVNPQSMLYIDDCTR